MIALRLSVPMACWRKAHAREYLETHEVPPPATCYGALLSLVGEVARERHIGVRLTGGLLNAPQVSRVLRSLWRVKSRKTAQGTGENVKPDWQELVCQADVLVLVDSSAEVSSPTLEERTRIALTRPDHIERCGGLSLGESTHLVNDVWLLQGDLPLGSQAFLLDGDGDLTLPTWVDHVGSNTVYAVGLLTKLRALPDAAQLPSIAPPPSP